MTTQTMNPATGRTVSGARIASRGARQSESTTARKPAKPILTVRLLPDGEPLTASGRTAQTLALLIECGARGFTSGEASPLGWARRTSDYVFRLRGLGVPIETVRETTTDGAIIARYILAGPLAVVSKGGGQ
jgi:hypothetical protein